MCYHDEIRHTLKLLSIMHVLPRERVQLARMSLRKWNSIDLFPLSQEKGNFAASGSCVHPNVGPDVTRHAPPSSALAGTLHLKADYR